MSTFYATIQGSRGPATRCGTSNSGIKAACQSYEGSIITRAFKDKEGKTMFEIETSDQSTCGYGATTMFRGTVEEFNEMCRLYKTITGIGKVKNIIDDLADGTAKLTYADDEVGEIIDKKKIRYFEDMYSFGDSSVDMYGGTKNEDKFIDALRNAGIEFKVQYNTDDRGRCCAWFRDFKYKKQ